MNGNGKTSLLPFEGLMIMTFSLVFACLGYLAEGSAGSQVNGQTIAAMLIAGYLCSVSCSVRMVPRDKRWPLAAMLAGGQLVVLLLALWELWIWG